MFKIFKFFGAYEFLDLERYRLLADFIEYNKPRQYTGIPAAAATNSSPAFIKTRRAWFENYILYAAKKYKNLHQDDLVFKHLHGVFAILESEEYGTNRKANLPMR